MLGEDGGDEHVAEESATTGCLNKVDVGEQASCANDDDDGSDKVAGCQAKDEGVAKFATSTIDDVGQDDGEGADEGEAANDHVDNVAYCADALALKGDVGVCGVAMLLYADGWVI